MKFTTFGGSNVKRLSSADFTVDTATLIGLKYKDCIICLFHTENEESHKWIELWKSVAFQTAGPVFAACNVLLENEVASAFTKVRMDGNHPFHSFGLMGWPVVIAYRAGYPAGVYNSEPATQPIIDWSLTMACRAGYFEDAQIFASMKADKGIEMEPPSVYFDKARDRHSSVDYKVSNPVRNIDVKSPILYSGTEAEKEGTKQRREENPETNPVTEESVTVKPPSAPES